MIIQKCRKNGFKTVQEELIKIFVQMASAILKYSGSNLDLKTQSESLIVVLKEMQI